MANLFEFNVKDIDGAMRSLGDFKDKVTLVVNVASKCGLTPQYDGLQRLYGQYRESGLEILAFPCNQFAGQEPGSEAEIKEFCELEYGTRFPLFAKIEVNGDGRAPLYAWLAGQETEPQGPGDIEWNFAKFLVGRSGDVIARFAPPVEPCAREVTDAVEAALERA
ncbi:MAG: glutathione peroxidase [Deltaproteobacteria bacterium]|nr:glutathione peroxidase [Deltaproteobacteria bacterium]MBW2419281.1 glutathione peroxidase [Deltaproteobacteria bacterium]